MLRFICFFLIPIASYGQAMSLEDCISYALNKHPVLKNNEINISIAEQQADIVRKNRLPAVSGSFSQTGSLGRNIDPFTNGIVTRAINFNSLNANAYVPIYNGFKQRYETAKAELETKAAKFSKEEVVLNKKLEIIQRYYGVSLLQESVRLKKNQLQDIDNQINATRELLIEGQVPRTAMDEIISLQLSEKANLLQIENDLQNELLALETAIFWKEKDSLKTEVFSTTSLEKITTTLNLQQHPTFQKAKNGLSIANYISQIAGTQFLPSVNFSVNLGTTYSSAAPAEFTLFRQLNTNFGQFAGLSVALPIFSKNQKYNRLAINKLTTKIAENEVLNTSFELQQQYLQLLNNYNLTLNRIELFENQRISIQKVYNATKEKYNSGLLNLLELSQWQNKFYEAELSLKIEQIKSELLKKSRELFR